MHAAPSEGGRSRLATRAFLLGRTPIGEADLVIELLTDAAGRVSAVAPQARRSRKRFGGSLEPLNTLRLQLERRPGAVLWRALDAGIEVARPGFLENLDRMQAAGRFLAWLKHCLPAETPEPGLWNAAEHLLDALQWAETRQKCERCLASAGWHLLDACGWRLELQRCVVTGKACPPNKPARVDPRRGGLVARGLHPQAPILLSPSTRSRLLKAQRGEDALLDEDSAVALNLVERTLQAHAGLT